MLDFRKVVPYEVHAMCDECGEELLPDGRCRMSSPPQYPHVCKNGHSKTFNKVYPCVEFKDEHP